MRLVIICLFLICLLCGCAPSGFPSPGTPGEPSLEPPKPPEFSEAEAVKLAKQHLSAKLSISDEEITVVSVEKVDWPDTSLGLPEPGKVYAQVIVPGFRIVLAAKGEEYEYHAGKVGEKMVVIPVPRKGT